MRRVLVLLAVLALLPLLPSAEAQKKPIVVTASSQITLDLPPTAGLRTPTPIRGQLTDNANVPVAGASVTVGISRTANGNPSLVGTVTTGTDGRFSLSYSFSQLGGPFLVRASYGGTTALAGSSQEGSIYVISAAFNVTESMETTRGSRLPLSGTIIVNGVPYNRGTTVAVTLGGVRSTATSGADGRFTIPVDIPATAAPGRHFANYTAIVQPQNQPQVTITFQQVLHVRVNASLRFPSGAGPPAEWLLGATITQGVTLVDDAGNGIQGVRVDGSLDGPGGSTKRTLPTGKFGEASFPLALPRADAPGAYNLTFSVSTTPHILNATDLRATVRLDFFRFSWVNGTPEVRRGTSNVTLVALDFGANRTTAYNVTRLAPGELDAAHRGNRPAVGTPLAVENGAYVLNVAANLTDPVGAQPIDLYLPAFGYSQRLDYRVTSRPTLVVESADIAQGRPSKVVFSVVDEAGEPVRSVPVTATLASADNLWTLSGSGNTTSDGKWTWAFEATGVPATPLTLNATSPGTNLFLDTQAASLTVQPSVVPEAFSYVPWVLGGLALVGAGGGTYWMMQRNKKAPPPKPEEAAAAVTARGRRPSLTIEVADIEKGLPAVWGANTPFRVRVRATGILDKVEQPLAGRKIVLVALATPEWPKNLELGANGDAEVADLQGPEGDYQLKLVYEGDDRFDKTELPFTVRLVDYRKEIGREFDGVVEKAALLAPKLSKSSTPREMQWGLEEKLPSEAHGPLEDLASVVENANYSTKDIGREDYVRLVRARQTLERHLPAGAKPAEPEGLAPRAGR